MNDEKDKIKKINVVGLGVGNPDYLTNAGIKCIKSSEILIGGKRQIEDISCFLNSSQEKYIFSKISDIICEIEKNSNKNVTVIVSGDTGFYSLLNYLKRNLKERVFNVIPGISSFQYLFGKMGETWEDYTLLSVHGRELDIPSALKKSTRGIILLTDSENSPYYIGRILMKNNFPDVKIVTGERLSYPDERITEFYARDFEKYKRDYKMNVVVVKKEK